jgi:hypothetical protein
MAAAAAWRAAKALGVSAARGGIMAAITIGENNETAWYRRSDGAYQNGAAAAAGVA